MKKKRSILSLVLFISILLLLAILLSGFYLLKKESLNARPLVLIHEPAWNETAAPRRVLQVFASASEAEGIEWMELWAGQQLIDRLECAGQVRCWMDANWEPSQSGMQELTVRAMGVSGIEGLGRVRVAVQNHPQPPDAYLLHPLAPDETLAEIADHYDVSEAALSELNPGLAEGELPAGSGVLIPSGDGEGMDESIEDDDNPPGEPVLPPGGPPGAGGPASAFYQLLFPFDLDLSVFEPAGDPVDLRVEITALSTVSAFERLHCYASVGGSTPRWVPDADDNPATDEYFEPIGGGGWQVAPHLSAEAAPVISWTANRDLPLTLTCVGGADAVDLGPLRLQIPPEAWDGQPRVQSGGSAGRAFGIEYRVSPARSGGVPLGIDLSINRPFNLRFGFFSLFWDYEPDDDDDPIDGFRIYLNGTLLWETSAEARMTTIAPEWYTPPCGESYSFTVSAFRAAPDDPESLPSDALRSVNQGDCEREVRVMFTELRTYDLGRDEDRRDAAGPVYGRFSAMGESIRFDASCREYRGYCEYFLLEDDSAYAVSFLADTFGGSSNQVYTSVPEGEDLALSFEINDHDPGPSRDDRLCGARLFIPWDEIDDHPGGVRLIDIDSGRCEVSALVDIRWGSPAADSGDALPLPLLWVDSLGFTESSGLLDITINNRGKATWPAQPLEIEVRSRDGSQVLRHTIDDFVLQNQESVTISLPELTPAARPLDYCVILDPENRVAEDHSRYGERSPVCGRKPEFRVTDVSYNDYYDQLHVTIFNTSREGDFINRTLELDIELADGSLLPIPSGNWVGTTLLNGESIDLSIDLHGMRPELFDGYTIIIDPADRIAELNEEDNRYDVPAGTRLKVVWRQLSLNYYPYRSRGTERQTIYMDVSKRSGLTRELLAEWTFGPYDVEPGETANVIPYNRDGTFKSVVLDLYGDEQLRLFTSGDVRYRTALDWLGTREDTFTAADRWGALAVIPNEQSECDDNPSRELEFMHSFYLLPASGPWTSCDAWRSIVNICEVERQ
ncbi:MAG: LysM peptidoglycan-binding domain-containing protein [Anaerolineaceae bacterium]|nr:LysM peptidoglycan-binding domain-containing protein [Anaerolineaceae bacterium]